MPAVYNRLPLYISDFSDLTQWNITGSTVATAGQSSFLSTYQTIKLSPTSASSATMYANFNADLTDVDRPLVFTCFVRCITGATCTVTMRDNNETSNQVVTALPVPVSYERSNLGTLASSGWAVIRSSPITPRNTGTTPNLRVTLSFTVNNFSTLMASTEPFIYLSIPVVTGQFDFQNNDVADFAFRSLPQVFRDYEASSTPDWPLFRTLDVLNLGSGIASDFLNNWTYVDYVDGFDGTINTRSQLVDPSVAPLYALQWLNQFIGSTRVAGTASKTQWGSVPGSWTSIISLMDKPPLNSLISWTEFESYAPSYSNAETVLRWQAETGYSGLRAGSLQALISAVQLVITGTKSVTILPMSWAIVSSKLKPSWEITLQTKVSETPDVTSTLEISYLVRGIIEFVKPAGLKVTHQLLNS